MISISMEMIIIIALVMIIIGIIMGVSISRPHIL